jgi:xanthine dehydrogenase iron-sulfur cluster and FAD-binding subunit A
VIVGIVPLAAFTVTCAVHPVTSVASKKITTIEGLAERGTHSVQSAWIAEQVPQCGYCQSGQIMHAAALLRKNPHPTDDEINAEMAGNICRCATYQRIRRAIRRAAANRALHPMPIENKISRRTFLAGGSAAGAALVIGFFVHREFGSQHSETKGWTERMATHLP